MTTVEQKQKTPLNRAFTFHFSFYKQLVRSKRIAGSVPYASHLISIATFQTVEDFWAYYQHMIRPEELPIGCEFFLFESQVKPMWEAQRNQGGGLFRLYIKKSFGNKFWEDLILGMIGEQCELALNITGIAVEVRERECVISVWVDYQVVEEQSKRECIREWIQKSIGISEESAGEIIWKKHEEHVEGGFQQGRDMGFKKKAFQDYYNESRRFENKKKFQQSNVEELMGRKNDKWRKQPEEEVKEEGIKRANLK